ncbi:MAG: hypothetical protein ACOCXF_02470 [bacterium]
MYNNRVNKFEFDEMIEDLLADALDEKEDPKHIHQYALWLKHSYLTKQRIEKNYQEIKSLLEEARTTMQAGFRMMDEHFDKIQASLEAGIAYSQKQIDSYSTEPALESHGSSPSLQANSEVKSAAFEAAQPYPQTYSDNMNRRLDRYERHIILGFAGLCLLEIAFKLIYILG